MYRSRRPEVQNAFQPRGALCAGLAALAVAGLAPAAAGVDNDDFGAQITLTSDYVFRGISQTRGGPALQGGLDLTLDGGFYAGIWASSVDLPPAARRGEPNRPEVDIYLGVDRELAASWSGVGTLIRYDSPLGDYFEAVLGLRHADRVAVFVSWADDYYGRGRSSFTYEITGRYPGPWKLDLAAGLGYSDLEGVLGDGYSFWNVGLSTTLSRFTLDLSYFGTDGAARRLFGESADERLVLSVTAAIRRRPAGRRRGTD